MARRRPGRLIVKSILSHAALISLSIVFLIPFVWLLPRDFDVSMAGTFTPAPAGEFIAPPYVARHFTGPMPVEFQMSGAYDPDLGTAAVTPGPVKS